MAYHKAASLLLLIIQVRTSTCFSQTSFTLATICDFQKRLDIGCFERIKNPRDQLECFTMCGWEGTCSGALIVISSSDCYHEKRCALTSSCTASDPRLHYYVKRNTATKTTISSQLPTTTEKSTTTSYPLITTSLLAESTTQKYDTSLETTTPAFTCLNSGIPANSQKCNCSGGWVGDRCERRPYNCSELTKFGYTSGNQLFPIDIYRNNSALINTPCNMGSNINEIGILKHSNVYSNNRSWSDYVNGYFYNSNNYWLGLENIRAYNKQGLIKVGILLTFSSSTIQGKITQEFDKFMLSDSSSGYSYTVGYGSSGSRSLSGSGSSQGFELGDFLTPGQNTRFSTYDRDQDLEPGHNCASLAGAGWWFRTCNPEPVANPLGSLNPSNDEGRLILPKYDTKMAGPKEAFKHLYVFLIQ